jgi:hypothetical protein
MTIREISNRVIGEYPRAYNSDAISIEDCMLLKWVNVKREVYGHGWWFNF